MKLTEEQYAVLQAKGQRGKRVRVVSSAYDVFPGGRVTPSKRQKYGNKKTIANGKVFASGLEARRYTELELMEKSGQIRNLQRQVPFDLIVNGQHVCTYVADAVYEQLHQLQSCRNLLAREACAVVVEDTKSPITRKKPDYVLKKKLMRACHGIEIREVMA